MQDDFDRNDPVDEEEDELPPGMHIVEEDEDPEEMSDEKSPSPLNLNEEYEEKAPDEL